MIPARKNNQSTCLCLLKTLYLSNLPRTHNHIKTAAISTVIIINIYVLPDNLMQKSCLFTAKNMIFSGSRNSQYRTGIILSLLKTDVPSGFCRSSRGCVKEVLLCKKSRERSHKLRDSQYIFSSFSMSPSVGLIVTDSRRLRQKYQGFSSPKPALEKRLLSYYNLHCSNYAVANRN